MFVLAAVILGTVTVAGINSLSNDDPERVPICANGGYIFPRPPQTFGELTLWVDAPVERRRPAGCEDFWGETPDLYLFSREQLARVDGVMFEDCQISWVEVGHSHADDVGVPC